MHQSAKPSREAELPAGSMSREKEAAAKKRSGLSPVSPSCIGVAMQCQPRKVLISDDSSRSSL